MFKVSEVSVTVKISNIIRYITSDHTLIYISEQGEVSCLRESKDDIFDIIWSSHLKWINLNPGGWMRSNVSYFNPLGIRVFQTSVSPLCNWSRSYFLSFHFRKPSPEAGQLKTEKLAFPSEILWWNGEACFQSRQLSRPLRSKSSQQTEGSMGKAAHSS